MNYVFLLIKIFRIAYYLPVLKDKISDYQRICEQFVASVKEYMPQFAKRLKVHLLLHLTDDMLEFGPPARFNTERLNPIVTI